jgi:cysteine desulfurase
LLAGQPTITPLIAGGGQERGRRGGTPALPAIAGMAAAASEAVATLGDQSQLAALRDAIEAAAESAGAITVGAGAARLGNTTCLALPGVRADTQVIALDLAGFQVSAGAACSSGKVAASHVLTAMGLGALAGAAVRVSLPWNATAEDAQRFITAYLEMARRLLSRAA